MLNGIGKDIGLSLTILLSILLRAEDYGLTSMQSVNPVNDLIEPLHLLELFSIDVEEVLLNRRVGTDSHDYHASLFILITFTIDFLQHLISRLDVDPKPFISFLNDYIKRLQDRIAYVRDGIKPQQELNIRNLVDEMDRCGITNQRYVVAQALLETGYFTSRACLECNNLFGLRRPSDGSYYEFDRWEESVKAYKDYVQYKYKGGDYLLFLKRIGYAEDPDYIIKVHQIAKTL